MSQHSPGPWTVGKPIGRHITDPLPIWANDAEVGDKMPAEVYGSSDARQLANANIVAAAPDMAVALAAILTVLDSTKGFKQWMQQPDMGIVRAAIDLGRKAVEKAKPPERSPRVSAAVAAAAKLKGCNQS